MLKSILPYYAGILDGTLHLSPHKIEFKTACPACFDVASPGRNLFVVDSYQVAVFELVHGMDTNYDFLKCVVEESSSSSTST